MRFWRFDPRSLAPPKTSRCRSTWDDERRSLLVRLNVFELYFARAAQCAASLPAVDGGGCGDEQKQGSEERRDQLSVRSDVAVVVRVRLCADQFLLASAAPTRFRPSNSAGRHPFDGAMRPLLVVVVVAVHRLATVAQADQRDGTDVDSLACTNDQIALSGFVTQKNPMNKPLGDVQKTSFNVLYLPSGALLQTTTGGCDQPSMRPGVTDAIESAKFPIFTYVDLSVQCGPRNDYGSVYQGLGNLFAGLTAPAKIYFLIFDSQVQQRTTANGYMNSNDISIDGKGDNVYFFFLSRQPTPDNVLDGLLPADMNESKALTGGNRTVLEMYLDKTTTATCKLSVRVSANDNTDSDALRSFSKTSVLFVSVSFIILMVISLAWLVFYYVQRFRYAHAKDRLARRLFNAAKKALARIPTRPLRQGDKELEADCPVCIDPYRCGDIVRVLPCRHIFHKTCVDPWLLEHRTCPMCKSDILKAFGYNFGHIEDTRGQGTADDHASADGQSSDGSEGSGAESYSAYPFPLATDSDTHDPFSFTPTGSPQMVQQVLHSNNAQGFAIIPLTVHSTTLQSARPGTGAGANQRPASMGNLTGRRSSDDSSLNDGLPSVPLHTAKSQHHSAQVHHPPVHSSSSSSCNALVLSGESSSSSDETAADPFKTPLTKATAEPAASHVTRSVASPSGDRLVHKPKTLAPLRTSGAPVFETGVSLSNSSFPLRKSSREVVNLVHVRSRSLSQDVATALDNDASRTQFGAASSFDHGVSGSVGSASPTASTSTRQTSAGRPATATAATFRRKSAAAAKLSSDDSTNEAKGKRNRRNHKYHSDENGTPDLGSLESL